MALQVTTTTTAVHVTDPVPPSMLVEVMHLVRKSDKTKASINPNEWNAKGSMYTSELYDEDKNVPNTSVMNLPTESVTAHLAEDLMLKDGKTLRKICEDMGITIEAGADKQKIVGYILTKQSAG